MIISDDQARRVAESLRDGGQPPHKSPVDTDVGSAVISAAHAAAGSAPDVRQERIDHARVWLNEGELDSGLIAEKMMCRIMSDWLR